VDPDSQFKRRPAYSRGTLMSVGKTAALISPTGQLSFKMDALPTHRDPA
jgi:hypothetical protein